jgi:hypothetical protein
VEFVRWGKGVRWRTYVAESPCFVDRVDCLKRLFDWGCHIGCVEEVGLDLCRDTG